MQERKISLKLKLRFVEAKIISYFGNSGKLNSGVYSISIPLSVFKNNWLKIFFILNTWFDWIGTVE